MSAVKLFLIALGLSALISTVAWCFIRLMLTPRQRFIDGCSETYLLVDCMARWEETHPMPADYGKSP